MSECFLIIWKHPGNRSPFTKWCWHLLCIEVLEWSCHPGIASQDGTAWMTWGSRDLIFLCLFPEGLSLFFSLICHPTQNIIASAVMAKILSLFTSRAFYLCVCVSECLSVSAPILYVFLILFALFCLCFYRGWGVGGCLVGLFVSFEFSPY